MTPPHLDHGPPGRGVRRLGAHLRPHGFPGWVLGLVGAVFCGCAVHYSGKDGTEHLWGFGHLKMRGVPFDQEHVALVKGVQTLGLNFGVGEEDCYVGLGWDSRSRLSIVDTNAQITFIWPAHARLLPDDLFRVRLGTNCPFLPATPADLQESLKKP